MSVQVNARRKSVLSYAHTRQDRAAERAATMSHAEKELVVLLGEEGGEVAFCDISPARERIYRRMAASRQGLVPIVSIRRSRSGPVACLTETVPASRVGYSGKQVFQILRRTFQENGYDFPIL